MARGSTSGERGSGDDFVDRFCLVGPAAAHVDRLQELTTIGVDQFAIYLMHDDTEHTLTAYGSKIIPALASGLGRLVNGTHEQPQDSRMSSARLARTLGAEGGVLPRGEVYLCERSLSEKEEPEWVRRAR